MLLKVENLTNGGIAFEREATATTSNAWEELTFDFSAINTANQYQKVVFIFDLGTVGNGGANFTYYFDDIRLVSGGGSSLTQMKLPVTFDDATVEYGLIGFGGADNSSIVVDPTNSGNKVAKVIKSGTAELWAGVTVTGPGQLGFSQPVPFTATSKKMKLKVWSPDANIKVKLKAELASDGTKSVETDAFTTKAGQWETLTFDFASQSSGTAALDLNIAYNKVSVFFNFGITGAQAGEKTYYFDDMEFDSSGSGGTGETPQTITFDAISDKTLGGAPFNLSATATSGLTVTFTTSGDKVTINGSTVTMVKAGRATINANQAGNNTFAAATAVERSFCIKPAKPLITISNDNSEVVTLNSNATSGNQWLLNGQAISGQTSASITVSDPGSYSVFVQVDDCKSENADAVPLVVTGDINRSTEVMIYPNPAAEMVYIRGVQGSVTSLHVLDVLGRKQIQPAFNREGDVIAVPVSSFSPGTYFITLKSEKSIYKVRFIRTDR